MTCPTNHLMGRIILIAKDAAGTGPVELELEFDQGGFAAGPHNANMKERQELVRRGKTICIQDGADINPAGSFSCMMVHGGNAQAADEFALKAGSYSTNTSTRGLNKRYACHVRFEIEGTDFGEASDTYRQYDDCEIDVSYAEGDDTNTVTLDWVCFGQVDYNGTILRAATT